MNLEVRTVGTNKFRGRDQTGLFNGGLTIGTIREREIFTFILTQSEDDFWEVPSGDMVLGYPRPGFY